MILGSMVDNVKSVQAVTTPVMILVLLPYLLTLLVDINTVSSGLKYLIYAIPFSYPFLASQKILLHDYGFIVLGILYEMMVFLAFVVAAARIFSTDKILTARFGRGKGIFLRRVGRQ
jgi:ABC-2 type transport system permease protein